MSLGKTNSQGPGKKLGIVSTSAGAERGGATAAASVVDTESTGALTPYREH